MHNYDFSYYSYIFLLLYEPNLNNITNTSIFKLKINTLHNFIDTRKKNHI